MIQTLSNLTIIIYAIAVMTMLLDTTPARLSRNKLSLLWAGAGTVSYTHLTLPTTMLV